MGYNLMVAFSRHYYHCPFCHEVLVIDVIVGITEMNDRKDLPPELIAQLSAESRKRERYNLILEIMTASGGTADLNTILIGIYRKTGVIETRGYMVGQMYRMAKASLVRSVKKEKGVYTVIDQPPRDTNTAGGEGQ